MIISLCYTRNVQHVICVIYIFCYKIIKQKLAIAKKCKHLITEQIYGIYILNEKYCLYMNEGKVL